MSKIPDSMLNGNVGVTIISGNEVIGIEHGGRILTIDPNTGTIILTLPSGLPNGFTFKVIQISPGLVYFQAGGGATLYNADSAIVNQFDAITVTVGIATANEWVLEGDLEPVPGGLPDELTYYWSIESVATTGADIDTWIEQKAAVGDNYTQTGSNRPTVVTNGGPGGVVDAISFTAGSAQFFPRFVYSSAIVQPCFITLCMDELVGGGGEGYVFDETGAGTVFAMRMSFGTLRAYTGGGGSFTILPFGTIPAGWYVLTVHYSGSSTTAKVDGGAWSAPFADGGPNGIAGLNFGQRSDGTLRATMRITDFGIGEGSQADAEIIHDYIRTLRGL